MREARSPGARIVRVLFLVAASVALVIVLFVVAVEGLFALYERSDKVTGSPSVPDVRGLEFAPG